jgi:hypothetical protein
VNLFDDETIIERSNVLYTADAQYARPQPDPRNPGKTIIPLIELLRSHLIWYRVQIKPESISATDYGSMQEERMKAITVVGQFFTSLLPLGQAAPELMPFMVEMVRWLFVAFRGGASIEGMMDQAGKAVQGLVQQAIQKRNQPPQPSPDEQIKLEGIKAKVQGEIGKAHLDAQATQQEHAMKREHMQAEHAIDKAKLGMDARSDALKAALDIKKTEASIRKEAMAGVVKMAPDGGSDGKKNK